MYGNFQYGFQDFFYHYPVVFPPSSFSQQHVSNFRKLLHGGRWTARPSKQIPESSKTSPAFENTTGLAAFLQLPKYTDNSLRIRCRNTTPLMNTSLSLNL